MVGEGRVRHFFYRLLRLGVTGAIAVWFLGGCAWHHGHKVNSYDRAISDEDKDPTYHADVEHADVEEHDMQ